MEPFKTTRSRDAWAAIRGFFYQAELIIDRWVELPDGHAIEVERGEDIDIVASVVQGQDAHRVLEQVKFRDAKITLNVAAPALASFHEHWATNHGSNLTFRYVTNARITNERISAFPDREPGVLVWERLRRRQVDPKENDILLRGIRATIRAATRPSDANEDTWAGFQNFVSLSSDDELLSFITAVEWSTVNPDPEALQSKIEDRLLQAGYCHTRRGATELYQRLFLFVFQLLSRGGLKRLTVADRTAQISRQLLSDEDHLLLTTLQSQMANAHARITDIEDFLKLFKDHMMQLTAPQMGNTVVRYGTAPVILDVPLSVEHCVARRYRVARYSERFNSKTWCAVHGDVGSGKTHLAIQVAHEDWGEVVWLRFRDKDALAASQYLYGVLGQISATTSFFWRNICREAVGRLRANSLIVLDDLPLTSGADGLDEQLAVLGDVCFRAGVKVFSTSAHRLSTVVMQALGTNVLQEEVPSFSDKEVLELLSVHGAPDRIKTEKLASGLATLTKKHPALLTAGIQYMAAREWVWDEEAFTGLVSGAYAWQTKETTRQLLTATVVDPETRALLNRLSLIGTSFQQSDVMAAANAPPTISRPLERLSTAAGLWVQQDSSDTFTLSPLISHLGADDLSDDAKIQTHVALGRRLMQLDVLGPIDLSRAVVHFASGREYNTAGKILLRGLHAFMESDTAKNDYGLASYWYDMPLPTEMDAELQVYLRLMQIQVRNRLGKDFGSALADIERLLTSSIVKDSIAPMAVAVVLSGGVRERIEYPRLMSLFTYAIGLWPSTNLPSELTNVHPEWMLWILGIRIRHASDLSSWFDALSNLSAPHREIFSACPLSWEGTVAVSEAVWRHEQEKRPDDRNWPMVLSTYAQAAEQAKGIGLELLWGCLVRAQITVKGEYLNDIPGALTLGNHTLGTTNSSDIRFLITECLGRQCLYDKDHVAALYWLSQAAGYTTDRFAYLSVLALVSASEAAGQTDVIESVHYSERAAALALGIRQRASVSQETVEFQALPAFNELLVVKVLIEYAIALWLSGNLPGTFEQVDLAFSILWAAKMEDDEWKSLFVICGHINGYLTALTSTGEPPAQLPNGEPYVAPVRGMMFRYSRTAVQAYNAQRDHWVLVQLATFATAVRADERAAVWAEKALDRIRSIGNLSALPIICGEIIGQMVKSGHLAEALEVGVQTGAATVAAGKAAQSVENPLLSGLDIDALLGVKPSVAWTEAEQLGAKLALIPIMLELLHRDVSDRTEAKTLAEQVARACELVKEVSSDVALWEECAELFRWVFTDRPLTSLLLQRADQQPDSVAHALCYLAVSLSSPPAHALMAQMAVLPSLAGLLRRLEYVNRHIVSPFLQDYWLACFKQKRVHFSTPAFVERALQEACASPLQDRGKRIVSAALLGLDVKISQEARSWLQT